ncbi:MAG TPA: HlyD family efflux transporter periplasmic adaptor subunit, partial [Bacillota bacterium]|nr:HlyD family efflux transporter periplasmic adaptor subunit [Bacillota bacterium]
MAKSGNSTIVPLRGKRRSDRHKSALLFGSGIIGLLVLGSVVWWGINTIKESLLSRMVVVDSALQGSLEVTVPAQAVLARDEQIVTARRTGKVKIISPEGERVRKGALLAYVTSTTIEKGTGEVTVPIYSPATGIVSYHVDNLETFVAPENLEKLGVEKIMARLETTPAVPGQSTPGQVQAGQPICKIVNNLKPTYFVVDCSNNGINLDDYKKGKYLYGKIKPTDKESTSFKIQGITKPYLIISSSASSPEFSRNRKLTLTMVI